MSALASTFMPGPEAADAARMLDCIGAGWMSQAVCVAAELGLADLLAHGPRGAADLARAAGCDPAALRRLLRALSSLGLFQQEQEEEQEERFALTPLGALLRRDADASLHAQALWWGRHLWPVWGRLGQAVRSGRSVRQLDGGCTHDYLDADPQAAAVFHRSMVELTRLVAPGVARAADFTGAQHVLDVGGGWGELLVAVLAAHPALRGSVLDRPHAAEGARARIAAAGLQARCDFIAGDFLEALPAGADRHLLKSILHNWDNSGCLAILRRCRAALARGGRLVLVERVMSEAVRDDAAQRAMMRADLNMLVGREGRERTAREFTRLLSEAGFHAPRFIATATDFTVIECSVPA